MNGMNVNNNNTNLNTTNTNVNTSKLKNIVKSKGFVTTACGVLAVIVLLVAYNIRIRSATQPVSVPVATKRLTARHLITEEDIRYVDIPSGALSGDYWQKAEFVIGQYVNYDTTIQEGSLFYIGSTISKEEMPDAALMDVPDGEILYYLPVNMLTSFTNSILPGTYIDIYISTERDGKALVGRFLTNVKILQVKTSDGQNVFDDSEESRTPSLVVFSLPEDQHILMRDIEAINAYSISNGGDNFSSIDVFPVPTKANIKEGDKEIASTVTSQYLKDFILQMALEVPQDITVPTNSSNNNNNNLIISGNNTKE